MKPKDYTNRILRLTVSFWKNTNSTYNDYFQLKEIKSILNYVDAISSQIPNEELIINFVKGLSLLPLIQNTNDKAELEVYELEFDELFQPLFKILQEYLETSYRDYIIDKEVTGEEIIQTDRVIVPITKKAIKQYIDKTKSFPIAPVDIEKIVLDFIDYKERIYSKAPLSKDIDTNFMEDKDKTLHNFPVLSSKYDAQKVYNTFFKGEIAVCNIDCFNDWFVNKYEAETITFLLLGRKDKITKTPTKAKAQLISFIVAITGDSGLETKLSYYTKVFGEDVKGSVSSGLNSKLSKLLKLCEL